MSLDALNRIQVHVCFQQVPKKKKPQQNSCCVSGSRSDKAASLRWHIMLLRKFHDLPLDVPHGQLIFFQPERSFITFETKKINRYVYEMKVFVDLNP